MKWLPLLMGCEPEWAASRDVVKEAGAAVLRVGRPEGQPEGNAGKPLPHGVHSGAERGSGHGPRTPRFLLMASSCTLNAHKRDRRPT